MPDAVTPFRVEFGDDQLDDLRRRLAGARWPEPAPVADWSQGVPGDWLRDLCAYWQDGYDWRRCEKTLAGFPQFTTELDGLGVHFIHVESPAPDALPLVMTHGWPGSVSSSSTSSARSPTRPRTAATRPTRSTSCARHCPATASAASPP